MEMSVIVERVKHPTDMPFVVIFWNGQNGRGGHYMASVHINLSKQPAWKPPEWLVESAPFSPEPPKGLPDILKALGCPPTFAPRFVHYPDLQKLIEGRKESSPIAKQLSELFVQTPSDLMGMVDGWVRESVTEVKPGPSGRLDFQANDQHRASVSALWCGEMDFTSQWAVFDSKQPMLPASPAADRVDRYLNLIDTCRDAGALLFGTSTRNNNCGIISMSFILSIAHSILQKGSEPFQKIKSGTAEDLRTYFAGQAHSVDCGPDKFFSFDELQCLFGNLCPELMEPVEFAEISLFSMEDHTRLLENVAGAGQSTEQHLRGGRLPGWYIGDKQLESADLRGGDSPAFFLVMLGDHIAVIANTDALAKLKTPSQKVSRPPPSLSNTLALTRPLVPHRFRNQSKRRHHSAPFVNCGRSPLSSVAAAPPSHRLRFTTT